MSCSPCKQTVKRYPDSSVESQPFCTFEPPSWSPCGPCGNKKGYPKGTCVKICVNGVAYIAQSTVPDNETDPTLFLASESEGNPWVIYGYCNFMNRPVGFDEQGNPIIPGGTGCYISCQAPSDGLEWVDDKLQVKVDVCSIGINDQGMLYALPQEKRLLEPVKLQNVYRGPAAAGEVVAKEWSVNVDDICGAGCRFNALIVQFRQSRRLDFRPGEAGNEVINGGLQVDSGSFSYYRGYNMLVNADESGEQDREGRDDHFVVPVSSGGTVTFKHLIKEFPDPSKFAHAEDGATVVIWGCRLVELGE